MRYDGEKLARARVFAKLTQLELATRCQVSTRTVMRWEQRGRSVWQWSRRTVDQVLAELVGALDRAVSRDKVPAIVAGVSRAKRRRIRA